MACRSPSMKTIKAFWLHLKLVVITDNSNGLNFATLFCILFVQIFDKKKLEQYNLSSFTALIRYFRRILYMFRRIFMAIIYAGVLSLSVPNVYAAGFFNCFRTPLIDVHGTIVDAAVATPELSTLVFALGEADLVDALAGPGPFTVYAPTDEAFAAIPTDVLSAILADIDILTAVLTYHVTAGKADPRRSFRPKEISTLQGQTVFFNRGRNGPQVNQSDVSCQGVRTDNGIVWLIDSVLFPQF